MKAVLSDVAIKRESQNVDEFRYCRFAWRQFIRLFTSSLASFGWCVLKGMSVPEFFETSSDYSQKASASMMMMMMMMMMMI